MIAHAFNTLIHLVLLITMPPMLLGVINKTKAWFGGRVGPPVLQLYYDLIRLVQKGMVISTTTTWIFQAGPIITLGAVLLAALLIPFGRFDAPIHFGGDLILFAYLFALGRFFTTAAALDTGSPFEGMGAAREVTFACLSEPALFLAFLVLVKLSGTYSLTPMLHSPMAHTFVTLPVASLLLIGAGLFIIVLAENCRIPVDDPNTHLELTMIHEVMVLDHSGPLLGFILYGASIKLFVLCALLLNVIAPFQSRFAMIDWPMFIVEMLAISVVIGVVESVMARLQMRHVPTLLVSASLLCGFGFLLMLR
ncbi:MAG TPA: NADH-quinone oxidoreductase subunit H [Tepidisphaeraceae bacterium]|nr:NADH-quinone oxidoreductase subunit H [Tepidisphaeraceae bacterium]